MGIWPDLRERRIQRTQREIERLEHELGLPKSEERGTTQDWVDAIQYASQFGTVRTSMPSLSEEQVSGSMNGLIKSSSPVFALTLARMQAFSQVRFQWTRFVKGEPSDLFGSPDLRVLERPWRGGTTADLLARMEMDVTAAGNSYIRRIRRVASKGGHRLVRLRPDWVITIMGSQEDAEHPSEAADVELLGYAYVPYGGKSDRMVILEPDELAHYAPYPDPDNVFIGMSWLTPAIRDVLGDNLQTDHKRAFLRNGATPNMVIKFDPAMSVETVEKFKTLFEAEHKGVMNAYKTLFLGGGADATAVGANFKELDFAVTQGKAESRMAADAGVPPSWVGFSEGLQGSGLNAGNYTASRRRFSDGTMHHLWSNAATSLESIVDAPDEGASLWFATRGVPFLRMDATDEANTQAKEASTIAGLIREGFTAESVKLAVANHDWDLLVHSGLLSVQLQPPGADLKGAGALDGGNS